MNDGRMLIKNLIWYVYAAYCCTTNLTPPPLPPQTLPARLRANAVAGNAPDMCGASLQENRCLSKTGVTSTGVEKHTPKISTLN